jgi:hypothetical protein
MSHTKRTYTELSSIASLEDRFDYLRVHAKIGVDTFGFDRWINQAFYRSAQWRGIRSRVIDRDRGCDMGVEGHEIHDRVVIHHMNPMTVNDLVEGDPSMLNPEYLITVSMQSHNAIHFGDRELLPKPFVPRRPGDTKLW